MKISTKGRYALRFLIDLAEHDDEGYVSLKDVSQRQDISKKYLEQIVPMLNRSGLLKTNRGFKGGYRLSKKPREYTVGEILRVTEGSLAPVSCLDSSAEECSRRQSCTTLPLWQGLYDVINNYLDSVTLEDMLNRIRDNADGNYVI